jgi:hypothetical protein
MIWIVNKTLNSNDRHYVTLDTSTNHKTNHSYVC